MPGTGAQRLFFALWPDGMSRSALDRTGKWLHRHWGGRRMHAETIHLTLAFLGETPAERLDALLACADGIRMSGYELVLDQAGYWRHNRIGWLGTTQVPPGHSGLVRALNDAVRTARAPIDVRPHFPHVTLLRNSGGGAVPACTPVVWPARDFVLVRSRRGATGAGYEVLRRWGLD